MPAPTKVSNGQKFGEWIVLKSIERQKKKRYFLCRCSCGQERGVALQSLLGGKSTSCGNCNGTGTTGVTIKGGEMFGRWKVTKELPKAPNSAGYSVRMIRVQCTCESGITKDKQLGDLTRGSSRSCGCLKNENVSKAMQGNQHGLSHGLTYHPLYGVWKGMIDRCYSNYDEHNKRNYKDRDITVCNEWRENVKAFVTWALKNGWKEGLTIDRKKNNGNYEPKNCHFVPMTMNPVTKVSPQQTNQRTNRKYWIGGKRYTISTIAHRMNIDKGTMFYRVNHLRPNQDIYFAIWPNNPIMRKRMRRKHGKAFSGPCEGDGEA